jgi:SAM-dependent methyltransferase
VRYWPTVSLFFRIAYLVGFKPWDTGVTPPELVEVVEGAQALPPGRALDLGCGTGTNVIYLAQHGWDATGVDLVPRAIEEARRRARRAGVTARFLVGDVTRLSQLGVGIDYTLLLDLGCYHSLPERRRDAYVQGAAEVAAPGALFLLYGFHAGRARRGMRLGPPGIQPGEVAGRFGGRWELERQEEGKDGISAWYRLRRRADAASDSLPRGQGEG